MHAPIKTALVAGGLLIVGGISGCVADRGYYGHPHRRAYTPSAYDTRAYDTRAYDTRAHDTRAYDTRDSAWEIVRSDPCRYDEYRRFAAEHRNPEKRRRFVERLARNGCSYQRQGTSYDRYPY